MANSVWVGLNSGTNSNGSQIFAGTVTAEQDGIAATSTDGFIALNATLATNAVRVQQAPRLRFSGNVWNTTSVAANNTDDWWIEAVPTSAATPSSTLKFGSSLNGGAVNYRLTVGSDGSVGFVTANLTGNVNVANGSHVSFGSRGDLTSPGDGQLNLTTSATTAGFGLDGATDTVMKVRTRAQTGYATVDALGYRVSGAAGASGTGTVISAITVVNGIITAITVA